MELADRLRQSSNNLSHRTLDFYERSLADHAREAVANDLSWIEGLLEGELRAIADHDSPAQRPDAQEITDNRETDSRHARHGVALTNDGGINV